VSGKIKKSLPVKLMFVILLKGKPRRGLVYWGLRKMNEKGL